MTIKDYVANFEATCVLKYRPHFSYYSINLIQNSYNNYNIMRVKVDTQSEITFSLNQKDVRFFSSN